MVERRIELDRRYHRKKKMGKLKERLLRDGIEPVGNTPEQFLEFTRREKEKWGKVVRDSGARVD